jgi:abortive infection bacteriophage resistance protein
MFESAPLVAKRVDLFFSEKSRLNKGSFPCQEISGVVSFMVIKNFYGLMSLKNDKKM